MKKFWIIISVCWLWTCGGGGGGSSPTEPQEPAPVSNFTATPTTIIQGQVVTFTSTSTGTITSYAWNVDDDPAIEGTTATYSHTYTEVGTYSVTLTVTGPGGSNPKTVADMITVSTAAPTPTTATSQTVQEDGSTTISLTATDPNGQAVTFAITTDPTNGTATLSGTEITYTPNANFYGTDSFDYTASNGTYTSDPVTITITVEGQDDEPTTNDVSATTDEDTAVTVNLDATEIDGDNYSFNIVSQPTNGTLGSVNGNQVEYTPNQDFNGTDTFTFEATDDRTYRRNVATATITVNPVNDAPVANDVTASTQSRTGNMRQAVTITLDASDVEGDDLTYSLVSDVSNGTTSLSGNVVTYTPTANYDGADTFTYKANDGTADSNTATGTITITDTNQAPIANDMNVSIYRPEINNYFNEIILDASDNDGDNLSKTIISQPNNGTLVSSTGLKVLYYPDSDFFGLENFTYKVNDGNSDSEVKTVTLNIQEYSRKFRQRSSDSEFSRIGIMRSLNNTSFLFGANTDYDGFIFEFDDNLTLLNSASFDPLSYDPRQIIMNSFNGNVLMREGKYYMALDSSFNVLFKKEPSNNNTIHSLDFAMLKDGNYLIAGYEPSSTTAFFMKVDSNHNILFEKGFSQYNYLRGFIELSDGNYLFEVNNSDGSINGLLKTNVNGDIIWITDFYPGTNHSTMIENNSKIFYRSDYSKISVFDLNGNIVNEINNTFINSGHSDFMVHSSGDLILFGNRSENLSYPAIQRIDENGNTIWSQTYEFDSSVGGDWKIHQVVESSDNNLIVLHVKASFSQSRNTGGVFKVDINDGTKLLP